MDYQTIRFLDSIGGRDEFLLNVLAIENVLLKMVLHHLMRGTMKDFFGMDSVFH